MSTQSWLRHDTPEALAWQAEQDRRARQVLGSLAEVAKAEEILGRMLVRGVESAPKRRGSRWFRLDSSYGPETVVGWSTAPVGPLTVLADPARMSEAEGVPVSLDLAEPSPDGRLLLIGTSAAGSERGRLRLLDVATGEHLDEVVDGDALTTATWIPDSSGFWYLTREGHATTLRRHDVGKGSVVEALPGPAQFPVVRVSAASRWAVVLEGNAQVRSSYARTPEGEWVPFLGEVAGAHWGIPVGDDYVAVVDDGAPTARLVRIPFATAAHPATWTELLPASDDVVRGVIPVGDLLVVPVLRHGAMALRVLSLDGTPHDDVPLPGHGVACSAAYAVSYPLIDAVAPSGGEATFLFSTLGSSWAVYRWSPAEGLEQLAPPAVELRAAVSAGRATSPDGTAVPYATLGSGNAPRPALLHAYGGFGLATLPGWEPHLAAWSELGGVAVLAAIRGGGELGAQWWDDGRLARKANGWDDFCAVAEQLRTDGTASAVSIQGGSNGGLLTGAAMVRRPELFAAVVSEIPLLDLLDYADDPVTLAIAEREYGDPRREEDRAWLAALSPVHNVSDGAAYPPLLLVAGANDPRCPSWHARTFADRVATASSSMSPVLLRVIADAGHGAAQREAKVRIGSEWLGFAWHHVAGATA